MLNLVNMDKGAFSPGVFKSMIQKGPLCPKEEAPQAQSEVAIEVHNSLQFQCYTANRILGRPFGKMNIHVSWCLMGRYEQTQKVQCEQE